MADGSDHHNRGANHEHDRVRDGETAFDGVQGPSSAATRRPRRDCHPREPHPCRDLRRRVCMTTLAASRRRSRRESAHRPSAPAVSSATGPEPVNSTGRQGQHLVATGVNHIPQMVSDCRCGGSPAYSSVDLLGAHQLTCSDNASSAPTGRTTAAGGWIPRGFDSAARQQPRGDRVRVPKLAGVKFIAAPHRRWHRWHQIEESLGAVEIDVHGHGGGGFVYVGDDAFPPASDLVTEQPKSARPFGSHGAFGHDASPLSVKIGDGCHLNHEAAFGDDDFERRVVEVARPAPLDQRRTASNTLPLARTTDWPAPSGIQ